MTPQTVNAYYNPGNNEIVFPAGILQAPFYDPQAEPVANLGGIGAVIGHEITHAFDTSGSQYDEKGNLRDWWTAQDKQHFRELAQKVIDYYDTMEVNGIQVNGTLSVTENIADLGGVSCITEIAREKGYDLKELYHAYGVIWATKYRDEYLSYIMTNDTHSPGITRVNAVLSATCLLYTSQADRRHLRRRTCPRYHPRPARGRASKTAARLEAVSYTHLLEPAEIRPHSIAQTERL